MKASEVAKILGLKSERHGTQYRAKFENLTGVSITGFGRTEYEASTDLFLRLFGSARSHLDTALVVLGHDREKLDVRETHEFLANGDRVVHLTNAFGHRHTVLIKGWRSHGKG